MINYAGKYDADEAISNELQLAGIGIYKLPKGFREQYEVKTIITGTLYDWTFKRAWSYWVAEGPGISVEVAEQLHKHYGKEIRVAGHCGCPSPTEWYHGFGVGLYHIDTQEGLNALSKKIKGIYIENEN
ncbi:hypothetical protein LCGC14_2550960 [marine sediment metagenome]|uniref:Uncharacterized protein n=1 Tax=marine sediment metagenome TaxID=412755 RepID=A0A0F9DFZ9_9ZZZZ